MVVSRALSIRLKWTLLQDSIFLLNLMVKRTRRTPSLTVSLSAGEVCQQPDLCPAFTSRASLSRASKAQSQLLPYLHIVIELRMGASIYDRRINICLTDPVSSFPWYYLAGQTRHLRSSKNAHMTLIGAPAFVLRSLQRHGLNFEIRFSNRPAT